MEGWNCALLGQNGQGIAYVARASPYRGGLAKSLGQSLAEWPIERGEALKATGLEAACRLSILYVGERRSGLPSTARVE